MSDVLKNMVDFNYLLLEKYKKLGLNESEVTTLMLINKLLSEGNDFITADLLSLKMTLSVKEIDNILVNLLNRKFIEYDVTKVEDDFKRRDFTVNAIYIDDEENVYDFADGISDLKKGVLKMIGDPQVRIKEDPLRILRALRFSLTLDFLLDEELKKAIVDNVSLLEKINPSKINVEIKKIIKFIWKC